MNKKLLVINKQNPRESRYYPPKEIGAYLWGRRISNYILMLVDNNLYTVIEISNSEVMNIQAKVNTYFD